MKFVSGNAMCIPEHYSALWKALQEGNYKLATKLQRRTNILNAMQLYIPDNETLSTFEEIVSPMYSQMQENKKQSKKLADLRDTLLPRLMSGELDVSEIEF